MGGLRGNGIIGIVREVKNKWERRAPLAPSNVERLVKQGIRVLIQPCNRRVFTSAEFENVGAEIVEDLSPASVILGVKEIPIQNLIPERTYLFFSHTIKAQAYNMPLLDAILEKNIRLIDYECIVENGVRGAKRHVAFGKYAGISGMVDTFCGLGQRMLSLGYGTPFLNVAQTFMYRDVHTAKKAIVETGEMIKKVGTPKELGPMTFVFTGQGNVSIGAQEIFQLMPHEMVPPEDLSSIVNDPSTDLSKLYGSVITSEHMVRHETSKEFDKNHYYHYAEEYEPIFHKTIAPSTSVLMNCMYWEADFPRLLTNQQQRELIDAGKSRLLAVGDITCDPLGSVEFLSRSSSIEDPFYLADVEAGTTHSGVDNHGIMMLGVDNLPAQLPMDASTHFGDSLEGFLPPLAHSDGTLQFDRQAKDLPTAIHGAIITSKGRLTPNFEHIGAMRAHNERLNVGRSGSYTEGERFQKQIVIRGHLFDSNLINSVLDQLEHSAGIGFRVVDWIIGGNRDEKTSAVIELEGDDINAVNRTVGEVRDLVSAMGTISSATARELPFASTSTNIAAVAGSQSQSNASTNPSSNNDDDCSNSSGSVIGSGLPDQKVLVLGSGMVSRPLVDYLYRLPNVHITLASNNLDEATERSRDRKRIHPTLLDVLNETDRMKSMVKESDLVISMLPASFHTEVAKACILHRKDMVTASYVSPEMKSLHSDAKKAGVVIINEIGLDPGIDHMSAMHMIDRITSEGGDITGFYSLCGGLPAPEAATNPLGYKFSWSPRGVLTAGLNAAKYLSNGSVVNVMGERLFQTSRDISIGGPALALEHLPNRNSLPYQSVYGLNNATSIYRGTLRYKGFSEIMSAFQSLGMFDMNVPPEEKGTIIRMKSWQDVMMAKLNLNNDNNDDISAIIAKKLLNHFQFQTGSLDESVRILKAFEYLDLLSESHEYPNQMSPLDALCEVLQKKLGYAENERDMVLLHHKIEYLTSSGESRVCLANLLAYGQAGGDSAMASTVGLPVGITASLMLQGKISLNRSHPGVLLPTLPQIYKPVLSELEREGIVLEEVDSTAKSTSFNL